MTTDQHGTGQAGPSEVLDSSTLSSTLSSTVRSSPAAGRASDRRLRRRRAMAVVAVVAVGAGLGGAALSRAIGSGSSATSADLPKLALAPQANILTGTPDGALGAGGAGGSNDPGAPAPGSGTLRTWAGPGVITVSGTLPIGPSSASIVRLGTSGPGAASTVRALGAALGLSGTPVRATDAWLVRGASGVLSVSDSPGHPWVFVRGTGVCSTLIMHALGNQPDLVCAVGTDPGAISSSGTVMSSGTVGSSGSAGSPGVTGRLPAPTIPPVTPPSVTQTLSLASPVFVAAGLDPARAVVTDGYARIDPTIDGRPTAGAATTVQVAQSSTGTGVGIQYADGWLLDTRDGPAYPIIGAETALQRLRDLPVPAIGMACIRGTDCTFRTVVTGATLGLTLAWDRSAPVFVPAWIFRTVVHLPGTGSAVPGTLEAIAVDPRFLTPYGQPTPSASGGPVPAPGGSAGSGTVSGVATAGPPSGVPGSPNTIPSRLPPRTPDLQVAPQAR